MDGPPVVDLWGGLVDSAANRPWDKDTIIAVASTTKREIETCPSSSHGVPKPPIFTHHLDMRTRRKRSISRRF